MSELSDRQDRLQRVTERVIECRRCPRLVAWREKIGKEKRASFRDDDYWARPVPSFGDPAARLVIVGLAPAAHGANRTGRMFTGDRSGDWLYRALHRAGFASQPESSDRDDGLTLSDAWVTSAVRCAPPDNKPSPAERDRCTVWFDEELDLLSDAAVLVCLGSFAYLAVMQRLARLGLAVPRPRPKFGHAVAIDVADGPLVLASYHPSQQNTFTGKLTEPMFDEVFSAAASRIRGSSGNGIL